MGFRDFFNISPSHKFRKAKSNADPYENRNVSPDAHVRSSKDTRGREIGHFYAPKKNNSWPIEYGRMSRRDTFEAMGSCGRDSSDSIDQDLRKYLSGHECSSGSASEASNSSRELKRQRDGNEKKRCKDVVEGIHGEVKRKNNR